jgi:hypothetical protein
MYATYIVAIYKMAIKAGAKLSQIGEPISSIPECPLYTEVI